jgi:hypothetical protein
LNDFHKRADSTAIERFKIIFRRLPILAETPFELENKYFCGVKVSQVVTENIETKFFKTYVTVGVTTYLYVNTHTYI